MTLSIWLGRLALVLAFLGIALDAEATDGYVDASYAVDGAARVSATNSYGPQAIVVRPGGRLTYASARPDAAYKDVLVGQRNADGSPDTGFAGGGQLRIFTTGAISGPRLAFDPYSRRVVLAADDFTARPPSGSAGVGAGSGATMGAVTSTPYRMSLDLKLPLVRLIDAFGHDVRGIRAAGRCSSR